MNRALVVLAIALFGACAREQSTERTIPYAPDVPIEERLQPGDTKVVVEMKQSQAPTSVRQESFEQEIQRLKRGDIIAVVRVSGTTGEIADRGTWIRTTVNAEVERIVRAPKDIELGPSIQFRYAGGSAELRDVEVTTGRFPRFVDGEQYLVILQAGRRGGPNLLVWNGIAFHADAAGLLQRIRISDGSEQPLPTNLVGRNLSEVADALAR